MPRKAVGDRPLTNAEAQARHRARRASQADAWRQALLAIANARTVREARALAAAALSLAAADIALRSAAPAAKPQSADSGRTESLGLRSAR